MAIRQIRAKPDAGPARNLLSFMKFSRIQTSAFSPDAVFTMNSPLPNNNNTNSPLNRRGFLRRAGIASATAALAPVAASMLLNPSSALADTATDTDLAVLNFALNLEYLEAEFYSYAVFGTGIESQGAGVDGLGTPGTTKVKDNPKINFSSAIVESYATEIAQGRDQPRQVPARGAGFRRRGPPRPSTSLTASTARPTRRASARPSIRS